MKIIATVFLVALFAVSCTPSSTPSSSEPESIVSSVQTPSSDSSFSSSSDREDGIIAEEICTDSLGNKVIREYDEEYSGCIDRENRIYLVKTDGEKLFLESVPAWKWVDIHFSSSGNVIFLLHDGYREYQDGVPVFALEDHFDVENNVLFAAHEMEDDILIVYGQKEKETIGSGQSPSTYILALVDRNGYKIKEVDTTAHVYINKHYYISVDMSVEDGVITVETWYNRVTIDEESFGLIEVLEKEI